MGKKKAFIEDRASAAHFHLVHRSQRDPLAATASQHVLTPAEISANLGRATSERASQSTRAWAAEQDLEGFDIAAHDAGAPSSSKDSADGGAAAGGARALSAAQQRELLEYGLNPADNYDYLRHLAPMGGGTFVPADQPVLPEAPKSEAGFSTLSRLSRTTRASRASVAAEVRLRATAGEAFGSEAELSTAVGDALGAEAAFPDTGEEELKNADPELWAALMDPDETIDDAGEVDDDFVLQADSERETELVEYPTPSRRRRGRRAAAAAAQALRRVLRAAAPPVPHDE